LGASNNAGENVLGSKSWRTLIGRTDIVGSVMKKAMKTTAVMVGTTPSPMTSLKKFERLQ
jgi:hypothetical protein